MLSNIRLRSALAFCGILVWIFVVFGFCFLLHVSYSLVQQDQRCIKGVAGKRYTFDLEYYTRAKKWAKTRNDVIASDCRFILNLNTKRKKVGEKFGRMKVNVYFCR